MRTNIDIDDKLLADAMRLSGLTTKKAVVEEGLRKLIRLKSQAEALKELWGMGWEGDLDAMRTDIGEDSPWGIQNSEEEQGRK